MITPRLILKKSRLGGRGEEEGNILNFFNNKSKMPGFSNFFQAKFILHKIKNYVKKFDIPAHFVATESKS